VAKGLQLCGDYLMQLDCPAPAADVAGYCRLMKPGPRMSGLLPSKTLPVSVDHAHPGSAQSRRQSLLALHLQGWPVISSICCEGERGGQQCGSSPRSQDDSGRQCTAEAGIELEKHPADLDGVKFGRNGDT